MEQLIAELQRLCFRMDVIIDQIERRDRAADLPVLSGPNAAAQNSYLGQLGTAQHAQNQQPLQQPIQQQYQADPAAVQFAQNQQFQQPVQQLAQQSQQPVQSAQLGSVTTEMILELAQPLAADEQARPLLQAAMNSMGIATLPDTRPDQYAELYHRFIGVKQQVEAARAGAMAGQALGQQFQQQPVQQFQQQPVQQFQQPVQQFQQPVQQFQQQPVQGVQNIV